MRKYLTCLGHMIRSRVAPNWIFPEIPHFLHACVTCSALPSNKSTMTSQSLFLICLGILFDREWPQIGFFLRNTSCSELPSDKSTMTSQALTSPSAKMNTFCILTDIYDVKNLYNIAA